jgi:hypothetical protein
VGAGVDSCGSVGGSELAPLTTPTTTAPAFALPVEDAIVGSEKENEALTPKPNATLKVPTQPPNTLVPITNAQPRPKTLVTKPSQPPAHKPTAPLAPTSPGDMQKANSAFYHAAQAAYDRVAGSWDLPPAWGTTPHFDLDPAPLTRATSDPTPWPLDGQLPVPALQRTASAPATAWRAGGPLLCPEDDGPVVLR